MSYGEANILYALYWGAAIGLGVAIMVVVVQHWLRFDYMLETFLGSLAATAIISALQMLDGENSTNWYEFINFGLAYVIAGIPVIQWKWLYDCRNNN